jgi:DNA-binding transcriptional LysR family regulator
MRFTFRQLEYFIAAAECGSITMASERINISQPSISTAISQLEGELGVQLFIRHHAQGLSLTPAGRQILAEAKRLIDQAEGLYALASEASEQVRGQISLGCLVTLAPMILPELSFSFTATYPNTRIRHHENHQEWLLDGLRRAEIDAAITYDLQIPDGIAFTPLASLPAHVVVGETHPFARRASVTMAEIAREPMVLLDLPLSREYFLALFLKEGLQPVIHSRFAHPEVVRTMVANGYGYSLANVRPRSDMALDGRRVVRVEIEGDHRPMVIGVATLELPRKSKLLEAFVAHCEAFVTDAHVPGMEAPASGRPARKAV